MSEQDQVRNSAEYPTSPRWPNGTKLFVAACILLFFVALGLRFPSLVLYLIVSLVLSFVIRPIVDTIDHYVRIPRWLITLSIYIIIFGTLISIPVSLLIPSLNRVLANVADLPQLIGEMGSLLINRVQEPFVIFGSEYFIPVDNLVLQDFEQYLGNVVSLIGGSVGSLTDVITSVATTSISFATWLVFVLFVSFYVTNAGDRFSASILSFVPDDYADDAQQILHQLDLVWGSFLRGQLILMVVMGVVGFLVASALGLPNPGSLGLAVGLLEVVPYAGPLLAAIPALILAYFQTDASWAGAYLSPLMFTMVVMFAYWLMQQLENYILLPRIMGQQLSMHPVFVFIGVIAGWQVAGIFGIFLASPMIATIRVLLKYFYCKITDQREAELGLSAETIPTPESAHVTTETEAAEGTISAET